MAIRYVTVAEARVVSGLDDTQISDADMTEFIEDIEFEIERYMNARFTPFVEIDTIDGNAKNSIFTKKAPLLTVRSLESNDSSISIIDIDFNKTGRIRLGTTSETQAFLQKKNSVIIKYVHGRVDWDLTTETATDTASAVGTSVALSVLSETDFSANDWVEIFGTDGFREVAQISGAPTTGEIVLDQLIYTHASGSLIRKLEIAPLMKRLIKVCVGIAAVTRAVGQSFDDIVGYTIGEFQVQKGEPFTQFRETIVRLTKQKDEILKRVRPTPGILV